MYHILVVDDEAKIREIIKKYAVFEGYRVTEAANGMEAIDLCRTEPFDLIIMDVMMPELTAFPPAAKSANTTARPSSCFPPAAKNMTASTASSWGSMTMWSSPFPPRS